MKENLKKEFLVKSKWLRLLFMVIYAIIFYILMHVVIALIAIVQFFISLFTGKVNNDILGFSKSLNAYLYQIMQYLTYNLEAKPFPLGEPWPKNPHHD
jgi:hypothetical protein